MESIPNQNHIDQNRPPTETEIEEMKRQNHLKYLAENPARKPEDRNNVVKIETEHAKYNIVYSTHTVQNDIEDIKDSDGIILELIIPEDHNKIEDFLNKHTKFNQQHGETIRYAAKHNIPLFFSDISSEAYGGDTKGTLDFLAKTGIVPIVGAAISYSLAKSSIKEMATKPTTRRSFLKNIGKVAAAAYLSTPLIESASVLASTKMSKQEVDESDVSRKIYRKVHETNNKIHPYLNSLTAEGRNYIIAHKTESLAQTLHQDSGSKSRLSVVIGAAHTGIEDSLLLSDENRLKEIQKYLTAEEIEKENTVVRVDWDQSTNPPTPKISQIKIDL